MLVAALVGGLVGALILVFAYFVGIALVGAGLGALVAHVAWTQVGGGDPPALLIVVLLASPGAVGAMFLQRYVIIVSTAFSGAPGRSFSADWRWSIVGAARAASDVWILYPFTPAPGAHGCRSRGLRSV